MQRRKSTPKVVVEEYMLGDGQDSSDSENECSAEKKPIKLEEKKVSDVSAGSAGGSAKPKVSKLKTHIEIDDFGLLADQ